MSRLLKMILLAATIGTAACSGSSPTSPGNPTPPVTPAPPAPVPNTPPTISSLTASSPRVEADGEVSLTAVVEDADTALDKLVYEWSSSPSRGTFTAAGRQARWVAPHLQPTPDLYTLTLTVTENYTDASGAAKQNKVTRSVEMRYNDSYAEMTRVSTRFLTELFANAAVTPQQAVQDFSDNCAGKAAERGDIENNRRLFFIESGTFSVTSINLNAERTSGTVVGRCVFKDTVRATGVHETVTGICTLDTVYENWKWLLCGSSFAGTGTTTSAAALSGRVPGRLVLPRSR